MLVACSRSDDHAKASLSEPTSFELVSDDPAVRDHRPAPPRPEDVLFADDFAAHDAARWREAASSDARRAPRTCSGSRKARAHGGLMLLPGEGGVHARIEVARSDALAVTVRVRSYGHECAAQLRVADLAERTTCCRRRASDRGEFRLGRGASPDWRRGPRSVRVSPCRATARSSSTGSSRLPAPVERAWLVGAAADAPPRARVRVELP